MTSNLAPSPDSAPETPVGAAAARGFAWMAGQTALGKLIALLGQIVLARLLLRDEWGLIGMAYTVSEMANLIQKTGQREILIQRHRRFDRWVSVAFWMSLAAGILNAGVMAAAAPLAAWAYGRRELLGLVLVLATWPPLSALSTVPLARLQLQMRFRAIATIYTATGALMMGLTILFAALGCHAYSFVLPWPIIGVIRTALMWWLAPQRIKLSPQLRRWKYLFGTSAAVFIGRASMAVISQADYMMLGLFYADNRVVGTYYFAFSLSMQTMLLLATNLESVLFPVLSRVTDPQRQRAAYLLAAQILAVLAIPVCLLQAGASDSILRTIFKPEWHSAMWPLAILSIGMAFRAVGSPSQSLIQAQGRFRAFMLLNLMGAAAFVSMVAIGAAAGKHWLGGQVTVAIAAAIYFAIEGPIDLYVAIRPAGGNWRDVWHVHAMPLLLSVIAVAIGCGAAMFIPARGAIYQWGRLLTIFAVGGGIYLLGLRQLAPEVWNALLARIRSLRNREQPVAIPSASEI